MAVFLLSPVNRITSKPILNKIENCLDNANVNVKIDFDEQAKNESNLGTYLFNVYTARCASGFTVSAIPKTQTNTPKYEN